MTESYYIAPTFASVVWHYDPAASGPRRRAFVLTNTIPRQRAALTAYEDGRWFVSSPVGAFRSGQAGNLLYAQRCAYFAWRALYASFANESKNGEEMTNNAETEAAYRHKYSVLETATGLLAEARQNGSPGWSEEEVRARKEWLRWRVEQGWESFAWPQDHWNNSQVDNCVRAYARMVLAFADMALPKEEPAGGYRDNARNIEVEALRARVAELEDRLKKVQEPMRVKVWQPNEKALAAGLEVGTTVRLPDSRLDVVMAYDHEGDPVVQGPAPIDGDYSKCFSVYFVDDLERVLPPPRED